MGYWKTRRCSAIKAIHPSTGVEITVDFQKDARIGSDLDKELVRLPGTLAWYMSLRSVAKKFLDEARFTEYSTQEDLYAELVLIPNKRTETGLKNAVAADPRMRAAYQRRMNAEDMVRRLEDAVEAITAKKFILGDLVRARLNEITTKDNV